MKVVCLLLAVFGLASGNWTVLHQGKAIVPANVYQIQLRQREILTAKLQTNDTSQINLYLYEKGPQFMQQSKKKKSFYSSRSPLIFSYTHEIYNNYYIIVNLTTSTGSSQLRSYKLQLSTPKINKTYQGLYFPEYPQGMPILIPYNAFSLKNTSFRYTMTSSQKNYYTMAVIYSQYSNVQYKKQNIVTQNTILQTNYCVYVRKRPQNILLIIKDFVSINDAMRNFQYKLEYFNNHSKCKVKCPSNQFWDDNSQQCTKIINNNLIEQNKNITNSLNKSINNKITDKIDNIIINITSNASTNITKNLTDNTDNKILTEDRSIQEPNKPEHKKDDNSTNKNNIGLILGIVLPIISLLFLLAIGCYCYKRKSKQSFQKTYNDNNLNNMNDNPIQVSNSQRNFKVRPQDMCFVCQNYKCNARLSCGHNFHKECIQKYGEAKQCPKCQNKMKNIITYLPDPRHS